MKKFPTVQILEKSSVANAVGAFMVVQGAHTARGQGREKGAARTAVRGSGFLNLAWDYYWI